MRSVIMAACSGVSRFGARSFIQCICSGALPGGHDLIDCPPFAFVASCSLGVPDLDASIAEAYDHRPPGSQQRLPRPFTRRGELPTGGCLHGLQQTRWHAHGDPLTGFMMWENSVVGSLGISVLG